MLCHVAPQNLQVLFPPWREPFSKNGASFITCVNSKCGSTAAHLPMMPMIKVISRAVRGCSSPNGVGRIRLQHSNRRQKLAHGEAKALLLFDGAPVLSGSPQLVVS